MQIVVAGRFDYIRFAWQKEIDSKKVMYFEDGMFRSLTFKNKLVAKIEVILSKFNKRKSEIYKNKGSLREYFDIDSLKRKDEILFILYETNFLTSDFELLHFLKSYYPKSKFVLDFTNAIGTVRQAVTKEILNNIDFFDLVYTFNEIDAKRYGFGIFPDISSDYSLIKEADCEEFDVFFAGRAKERLEVILSVAKRCLALGLKIRFYIVGVPNGAQEQIEGVYYTEYIPYLEMLSYIKKGKAVLNILNGVSSGIILRDEEAMGMNKVLITDTEYIFKTKYYTDSKIIPLSDLEQQAFKIINQKDDEKWNCGAEDMNRLAFLKRVANNLTNK